MALHFSDWGQLRDVPKAQEESIARGRLLERAREYLGLTATPLPMQALIDALITELAFAGGGGGGGSDANRQVDLAYAAGGELDVAIVAAPMTMKFDGTIVGATLNSDIVGDLTVQLLKNGVNICAAAPLAIAASDTVTDETLTGWTVGFVKGDTLQAEVLSVSGVTAFDVSLEVEPV